MELDEKLLFNFVPALAAILLTIVTGITVFQRLKLRWPIKVNCWFCNSNTKVWRQESDWWLCPSCDQYNGFSQNGDYKYNIPEQYKTLSNSSINYCANGNSKTKMLKNTLCEGCIKHEELKLIEFSNFEPRNEKKYEEEVKQFKCSLEEKYPLCSNCNNIVQSVLAKQAAWLAHYKMSFFKQKPVRLFLANRKKLDTIFKITSTIFDLGTMYNTKFLILPIGGLFFQLCASWVNTTKKKSSDILLTFLWICIIILAPFKEYKILRTNLQSNWFTLEYVTQYHMVMILTAIIAFINIKSNSTVRIKRNILLKKIETTVKAPVMEIFPEIEISNTKWTVNKNNLIVNKNETIKTTQPPVNMTNYLMTPVSVEVPTSVNSTEMHHATIYPEFSVLSSPVVNNFDRRSSSSSKNNNSSTLDDSLSILSTLSIDEHLPKYEIKSPKMFKRRVYNTISPDLFKKSNNVFNRKNILSPPKLKSVTQTSWVAGGYWQENMDAPSLSRSSSQSSGFGSVGSNCGQSREPSIHEFDQCSVVSDSSYCTSRQNYAKPIKRFCLSGSLANFVRPKSPTYNQHQGLKLAQNHSYSQQMLVTHFQKNNEIFEDHCSQYSKIYTNKMKNTENSHAFSAFAQVAANPVWLSALLCGSLVLNMIVLCTTLMR